MVQQLGAHAKFRNPSCLLSGRKVRTSEEEEERRRKIMPSIVATYVYASSRGQRTHFARTKIPKIVAIFVSALGQPLLGELFVTQNERKKRRKEKHTGSELCQARVKLG